MAEEKKEKTVSIMDWLKGLVNNVAIVADVYEGAIIKGIIVLLTTALTAIVNATAYQCPCVSTSELGNCTAEVGNGACATKLNMGYGLSFIVAPAVALFIFGIASNPKFWKSVTGSLNRDASSYGLSCKDVWRSIAQVLGLAMIAPITWVVLSMLDGRFYACAVTPLPYNTNATLPISISCQARVPDKFTVMSNSFNDNKRFSQLVGWILTAACLSVGFLIYAFIQCNATLTYYQDKFYRLYRKEEQLALDDKMSKKALKDTEGNVTLFLDERRKKDLWDELSSTYEFRWHRNFPRYTYLQGWAARNQKNPDEANPTTTSNDDASQIPEQRSDAKKDDAKKEKPKQDEAKKFAISDFAGTYANITVAGITVAAEQFTTVAEYVCPCVSPKDAINCPVGANGNLACHRLLNFGYGMMFIAAPAVVLLVFGMVINPKMWKAFTGCITERREQKLSASRRGCSRDQEAANNADEAIGLQQNRTGEDTSAEEEEEDHRCTDMLSRFVQVLGMATIAPITWIAVAFLDGRFYACAMTPLPYYLGDGNVTDLTCDAVAFDKLVLSDQYLKTRRFSQILGWLVIAGCLLVGFVVYTFIQSVSDLTYYHDKFYKMYRAAEETKFTEVMTSKSNIRANDNVDLFLKAPRTLTSWNDISTIHNLPKDGDGQVIHLYSHLDKWATEERKRIAAEQQKSQKASLPAKTDDNDCEQKSQSARGNGTATSETSVV